MKAANRNRQANRRPVSRGLIGSTSNILLLGFLAGVFAGFTMPASTMYWLARLTLAGFAASVVITMIKVILANRAEHKANEQAAAQLERRMERLIPKHRVMAHGTHSHRPHTSEESQSDRIPAARRERKFPITR